MDGIRYEKAQIGQKDPNEKKQGFFGSSFCNQQLQKQRSFIITLLALCEDNWKKGGGAKSDGTADHIQCTVPTF